MFGFRGKKEVPTRALTDSDPLPIPQWLANDQITDVRDSDHFQELAGLLAEEAKQPGMLARIRYLVDLLSK